jgi:hypothetical protein
LAFSQHTLHFGWRHGFLWQQVWPQAAFSQQAGAPQAFAQGFGQAFSHGAGAQATGFGQAFSHGAGAQATGFGQAFSHGAGAQATGFGQAFSHGAGAQATGFGQAFSHGAGQQAAGFGQAFSHGAGPHPFGAHGFSQQHFTLPHLRQAKRSFIPLNKSHRLQQVSQAGWPQVAAGVQALAAGLQAAGAAHGLHSPQAPQFRPRRRSPRSKPNPWLARATLTRSAPSTILPFIEQTLLNNELG